MSRDNSPKERQRKQLERKLGRRAAYNRILIVSEGSKTEPLYFNEIRTSYRLHTANVEVRPSELGTAPIQVVQYAHDLFVHGDKHKGIQPCAGFVNRGTRRAAGACTTADLRLAGVIGCSVVDSDLRFIKARTQESDS